MKPFDFQEHGIHQIESFQGRSLVAWDMGLGKTYTSLEYLRRHAEALPAVVVCPAGVKYQWEAETRKAMPYRALVLEGRDPQRLNGRFPLIVINYDILRSWVDELKRLKPQCVIIDESQYCMNPQAIRTRVVKALCRRVPYVLALSGTPLVNRPIELFPILQILQPEAFSSRWKFGQSYCAPQWTPWGWKFTGASNSSKLHRLLNETCMIRYRKEEVLKDLPPKLRDVIPIPIRKVGEYERADSDFLNWLRTQDPNAVPKAQKAIALVKIGYLLRLAARLKLFHAVEWINEWLKNTDEKMVIFANHRKMVEALRRRCKALSVVVDGSVTGRQRQAAVDQFQQDRRTRLLIGNLKAAGVGLNLTAASTVVFTEIGWRPGDHTQGEDRCYRIGTTRTVWCHYLVARNSIEEKLCELIQQKQRVITATLDGSKIGQDLDVYDKLMTQLRKRTDD